MSGKTHIKKDGKKNMLLNDIVPETKKSTADSDIVGMLKNTTKTKNSNALTLRVEKMMQNGKSKPDDVISDKSVDITKITSLLENDSEDTKSDHDDQELVNKPVQNRSKKGQIVKKSAKGGKSTVVNPSDLITADEIEKRMKNYSQVNAKDVETLVNGARIQYFEVFDDDGEKRYKYKPGAILLYNGYPNYIVLSNGLKKWSVQLKNHILFEENIDAVKRSYAKIIREKNKRIAEYRHLAEQRGNNLAKYEKDDS